ncbi:MAG TPA: hypothetical protein VFD42_07995, partial [Chloroflexota bacterium]|nr:hypothetical protein [Chloroflexota bacterium]
TRAMANPSRSVLPSRTQSNISGLAMEARPEMFDWVRLGSTDREGLAIALVGGLGAIGFAVLAQVLSLLRGALGDDGDIQPH